MKRNLTLLFFFISILLSACSSNKLNFTVEIAPHYKAGETFPFVIKVENNGSVVSNLEVYAILEMAKMDHGHILVDFNDMGNGLYEGEVSLPMGGEWIATIFTDKDGQEFEEVIIFDVNED